MDEKPGPFRIRNSNSPQIMSQVFEMGIKAKYNGILKDDLAEIEHAIQIAATKYNLTIFTGGVSVGEKDLLPDILESNGYRLMVTKTAIQPGKPMLFAVNKDRFCFGLSGNPVSSYIQFIIYVKPFIYKLMGLNQNTLTLRIPLAQRFARKKTDRLQFVPGRINVEGKIEIVPFHGSAHIHALSMAHCLFEIPIGKKEVLEDEIVKAHIV